MLRQHISVPASDPVAFRQPSQESARSSVVGLASGSNAANATHVSSPSSTLTQRYSSSTRRSGVTTFTRLDLDAAFFWLLLVFLVTVVSFLNMRGSHVELSPSQVVEYERRTQNLANSSVYIVEVHRPEGLLSKLSPGDWARVSRSVDYVAFVFDDLPIFLADEWVSLAEHVLRDTTRPHTRRVTAGIGILLFPCGCIIPNAYFAHVSSRLGGMECLLLPGWVLPHSDVHWLPQPDVEPAMPCRRQKHMSTRHVVNEYGADLAKIRRTLEKIRADLPMHTVNSTGVTQVDSSKALALR